MTPENVKQLLFALQDNVRKYEETFGEIMPKTPRGGNAPLNPFGVNNGLS